LLLIGAAVLASVWLLPAGSASAVGNNIGGGTMLGTVNFSSGIPPLNQPCAPTSFTLQGQSLDSSIFNSTIVGYLGEIDISGTGGSSCEGALAGSGNLTLTSVSSPPAGGVFQSTIKCADPNAVPATTLSGTYTRNGADVEAVLSGNCIINGSTVPVGFIFRGPFVPTNSGGGTTAPVTNATFTGPFVVSTF
jgi:hypothetical protein